MPSFQDSAVIFFIALLLFGPKKLPELARYIGKLMHEFRKASSEFRNQMDDEFRQIEMAEHQKKIAALPGPETTAPAPSIETAVVASDVVEPDQLAEYDPYRADEPEAAAAVEAAPAEAVAAEAVATPIATSGELELMPPATGLPVERSASSSSQLGGFFDSIPQAADPAAHETGASTHG